MSIHRSLRMSSAMAGHRNVLTRVERLEKLEAQKRWNEEKSANVTGLPKVRSIKVSLKKKKKKKEGEEEA